MKALLCLAVSLLAGCAPASQDPVVSWMEARGVPGLQVAILDERGLAVRAYGVADREQAMPLRADQPMRLASVSKPITTALVARLTEAGLVDLDAEVTAYLPRWPHSGVTLRRLASHLGGVRSYETVAEYRNQQAFPSAAAVLPRFQNDPLVAEPGRRHAYSSYGYTVIHAALEAATGRPYMVLVDSLVAQPAGVAFSDAMDASVTYYQPGRAPQPAQQVDLSDRTAGGGLYATAEDIARFAEAWFAGRIASEVTVEQFIRPVETAGGEPTNYGLGWASRQWQGRPVYGHTGGTTGSSSILAYDPQSGRIVVVLANQEGLQLDELAFQLLDRGL
ncbi:MAG: serine hydrolase domain-containing protein [Bacteroidota bacterium]